MGLPITVVPTHGDHLVVVQRVDLDITRDPRARELAVADNRVSEVDLSWDASVLQQLKAQGLDVAKFWTSDEFERQFGLEPHEGETDENAVLEPGPTAIVRGDRYQLGRHRIACGDATDGDDVTRLLDGARPVVMPTDAPYGVTYRPEWRHAVNPAQRTAVGAVANDDRADWSAAFVRFPGDVIYAWHAGLHAATVAHALAEADFALRSQIIWAKQHFAMSRGDFHWAHEPCWYAVRKGKPSRWRGDRRQTTVWDVPNLNPMGGARTGENAPTGHSTQKPVRLFELPILHHTNPGDAIYDPFVGSGTAVIAAEKTGRTCYAMDLDPRYVQVTITRWEEFTGQRARPLRPARPNRRRQ
jgi:hypothetical protein